MRSLSVLAMVIFGRPATGPGATTSMTTTGSLEHGWNHQRWASCGHLAIGAGAVADIFLTMAIGVRTSDFMAESITASAILGLASRAAVGTADTSSITAPWPT